jgi:hypothetical protein
MRLINDNGEINFVTIADASRWEAPGRVISDAKKPRRSEA